MELIYENELGKVYFGGGRKKWNVIQYSGFSLPKKTFNTVKYAGETGQQTLEEVIGGRTMTLQGDFYGSKGEISSTLKVLHAKGTLYIYNGLYKRKTEAYVSHMELGKKRGMFQEFTLQFTADNPYFSACEEKDVSLYKREDMVSGFFMLPQVFTERITEATVTNRGDVEVEPMFSLYCNKAGESTETKGILIENVTTGARFNLDYAFKTGETVTVDIGLREITSDMPGNDNGEGNLLLFIGPASFMHKMFLVPGPNLIKTQVIDPTCEVVASCRIQEQYVEVVI